MQKNYRFVILFFIVSGSFAFLFSQKELIAHIINLVIHYRNKKVYTAKPTPVPTLNPIKIGITPPLSLRPKQIAQQPERIPTDETEWGKAKQIDDVTYTIKVGHDASMGTPQEILDALNAYRGVNNRGSLTMDEKLSQYAQTRADYFKSTNNTDKHAGFNHFLEEENGFQTLGFRRVGENSYYGGELSGVHLIEWVFAQSPGHNANQLDQGWSHIGVGVTDTSVDIIFAADRT